MDWSEVGKLVGPLAPTIGSILGGFIPVPGGALLGQVAGKVIAEALGVPPTPQDVHNAITTGDQAAIQAKLAVAEAAMNAEVEKFKASMLDVQDARETTVKYDTAGSGLRWGPVIMSTLITVGFIGCVMGLMFVKVNFTDTGGQAYLILTGVLSQAFAQVCNYWLGSSAGSANKDDKFAALLVNGQKPVAPVKR